MKSCCQKIKRMGGIACIVALGTMSSLAWAGVEDLDRGHRLLLEKGLQLQAYGGPFEANSRLLAQEANFTTIHYGGQWPTYYGGPWPTEGDLQWAKWSFEPDYWFWDTADLSMLATASINDESDITDPAVLDFYRDWHIQMRAEFPTVISAGQHGSHAAPQTGNPASFSLGEINYYKNYVRPDTLVFAYYPFIPGRVGVEGGSPTSFYSIMGTYRESALDGHVVSGNKPIPYGLWYQSCKMAAGHTISESELAVQYYASWAYGFTMLKAFTFDTPASPVENSTVFFDGAVTHANRTPLYFSAQKLNNESLNLAPALLRLVSTDIRFLRGQHGSGTYNNLPDYAQNWNSSADPYMEDMSVNNPGSKNGGLNGDLLVGYFNVLDEEFDGSSEDEIYFMITNGLTDPFGTSAQTLQNVTIDFDFGSSGITQLQRLDRTTGDIVDVPLAHLTGSQYRLDWTLLGGEGDLFKYDTGAKFVSSESTPPTPPIVGRTIVEAVAGNLSEPLAEDDSSDSIWSWKPYHGTLPTFDEIGGDAYFITSYNNDLGNDEDCPQITQEVDVAEGVYDVYLLFYETEDYGDGGGWYAQIQAALTGETLVTYDHTDGTDTGLDMPMWDDAGLREVYLGRTGLTTLISVDIDDMPGAAYRSMFEGLVIEELLATTLPGDANQDGVVDSQDFTILKAHFGETGGWSYGNFNGDFVIDSQDFTILKAHFGETASMGAVPEPATLGLLLVGGLALLRRRR